MLNVIYNFGLDQVRDCETRFEPMGRIDRLIATNLMLDWIELGWTDRVLRRGMHRKSAEIQARECEESCKASEGDADMESNS
jgi:hypothetical protein